MESCLARCASRHSHKSRQDGAQVVGRSRVQTLYVSTSTEAVLPRGARGKKRPHQANSVSACQALDVRSPRALRLPRNLERAHSGHNAAPFRASASASEASG